jgi:hypothetical protein
MMAEGADTVDSAFCADWQAGSRTLSISRYVHVVDLISVIVPHHTRRHMEKVLDAAPIPCGRPQLREMIRDEIGDAHEPSPDKGSTQKRRNRL